MDARETKAFDDLPIGDREKMVKFALIRKDLTDAKRDLARAEQDVETYTRKITELSKTFAALKKELVESVIEVVP